MKQKVKTSRDKLQCFWSSYLLILLAASLLTLKLLEMLLDVLVPDSHFFYFIYLLK